MFDLMSVEHRLTFRNRRLHPAHCVYATLRQHIVTRKRHYRFLWTTQRAFDRRWKRPQLHLGNRRKSMSVSLVKSTRKCWHILSVSYSKRFRQKNSLVVMLGELDSQLTKLEESYSQLGRRVDVLPGRVLEARYLFDMLLKSGFESHLRGQITKLIDDCVHFMADKCTLLNAFTLKNVFLQLQNYLQIAQVRLHWRALANSSKWCTCKATAGRTVYPILLSTWRLYLLLI